MKYLLLLIVLFTGCKFASDERVSKCIELCESFNMEYDTVDYYNSNFHCYCKVEKVWIMEYDFNKLMKIHFSKQNTCK